MKRSVVKSVAASLCFVLLAWMVWQAGPRQLWQTLCSLPLSVAGCVAIWGAGYLLNAASFRTVISGVERDSSVNVPFAEVLRLTVAGYAINYITPLGLLGGEPWRVLQLKDHIGAERATQSVVLYSMMHVASHFCLWLLSLCVAMATMQRWNVSGSHPWLAMGGMSMLLVLLLRWFWRLYRRGIAFRFMRRWVDWPLLNPSLLPSDKFLKALALELISRLVNVLEYWIIMHALGFYGFGYVESLLTVAFSSLLANLLFFSPLQMGTREGGILLALQYLLPGELLSTAVTLSFATRIREFIWIAIGLLLMRGVGLIRKNSK